MNLRGILRGFGLKIGRTNPNSFGPRVEELVEGHPTLAITGRRCWLRIRSRYGVERVRNRVRRQAPQDKRVRLMMTTPGVGPIVGLTYVEAIDVRRGSSRTKQVGPHFGMTPKKYQSGETDYSGRISKIGDASVRTALYEAANAILTRPLKGATALKSWAMKLARRAGMAKAKVALARSSALFCIACGSSNGARRQTPSSTPAAA